MYVSIKERKKGLKPFAGFFKDRRGSFAGFMQVDGTKGAAGSGSRQKRSGLYCLRIVGMCDPMTLVCFYWLV